MAQNLLIIIIGLVINDVEEAEFVDAWAGGHDAQPIAELLFLEELFRPVAACVRNLCLGVKGVKESSEWTRIRMRGEQREQDQTPPLERANEGHGIGSTLPHPQRKVSTHKYFKYLPLKGP